MRTLVAYVFSYVDMAVSEGLLCIPTGKQRRVQPRRDTRADQRRSRKRSMEGVADQTVSAQKPYVACGLWLAGIAVVNELRKA